jgi:hypothetical protein
MGESGMRLSTAQQRLRWLGLAAIILALVVTAVVALRPLAVLLFLAGVGCYVAMAVLAGRRRQQG